MNTSNKQFLSNSIKWMFVYLGISLTISFLVPFPASLVIIIITVFAISFMRRKLIMKNTDINIRGMFSSNSSRPYEYSRVKYFCMSCGLQHKETECPKCGSKMKRLG
ncbi:MAG: hypothetical protein ACRD8W_04620 [Nitrososphaeraceae archaeon]